MATEPLDSSKKRKINALDEGLSATVRCRDLWFEDGNIIIAAENTQFRVHRGFVASHSEVFRGMFTIPQPAEDLTVDECRVVHVLDSAIDWERLLKAMYNCFKTERLPEVYPIERVISLLRLGHKYEFDFFRDIAVQRIENVLEASSSFLTWGIYHLDTENHFHGHLFELAKLLFDIGMTDLQPMIFFLCIREDMATIRKGMKKPDGSISVLPAEVQVMLLDARSRISKVAIEQLLLRPLDALQKAHKAHDVVCTLRSNACARFSKKATERILWFMDNPGKIFDQLGSVWGRECQPCDTFTTDQIYDAKSDLWESFLSYFDLPVDE